MKHIEKMADAIYKHTSCFDKGINVDGAAQAAFDALIEAVPDLVWVGREDDCFVSCEYLGNSYEMRVTDTLERSCDYIWQGVVTCEGQKTVLITPRQPSFGDVINAANAYNREQIGKIWEGTP